MLKSIFLASRPKTLPAAIVPVWAGCVLAWRLTGQFSWLLALCAVGGSVFIQIATNFFNDAIDADKGADTEARLGPKRATASGLLSRGTVYGLAALFLVLAIVIAIPLLHARGWPIVLIGAPSLFLAYGYTGGPFPLAYLGLGELFVILFFGIVAVMGTVFVQTGSVMLPALWLGLAVGALSAVLITINNLRDVEEDSHTGKRTLAVRWGWRKAAHLLTAEYALVFLSLSLVLLNFFSLPISLLYSTLCVMVPALIISNGIRKAPPSAAYNRTLALAGLHLILFAVAWNLLLHHSL